MLQIFKYFADLRSYVSSLKRNVNAHYMVYNVPAFIKKEVFNT